MATYLILMLPASFPFCAFSMLTFTSASSPNALLAYRLAARNPQAPLSAIGGVRHLMLVLLTMWSKNSFTSVIDVLTATCKCKLMNAFLRLIQCLAYAFLLTKPSERNVKVAQKPKPISTCMADVVDTECDESLT